MAKPGKKLEARRVRTLSSTDTSRRDNLCYVLTISANDCPYSILASAAVAAAGGDRSISVDFDTVYELFMRLAEIEPSLYKAPVDPRPGASVFSTLEWISLTHVCRFGRYVGLDMPFLWARAVSVFPSAVPIFLERAAPLTLIFNPGAGGFFRTPCIPKGEDRTPKTS
jgi:hypothetical protein